MFAILCAVSGLAQPQEQTEEPQPPPTRLQRIWKNVTENKIVTTLQLDRDEYMAGETMEVTVIIRNPGEAPLEAHKPIPGWWFGYARKWDPSIRGRISLVEGGDELAKETTGWLTSGDDVAFPPSPEQEAEYEESVPSIVLQPGQTLTAKFHSYEMKHRYAQEAPGTYRISFPGAHAEYQVVAPLLERFVEVDLHSPYTWTTSDGKSINLKNHTGVLILGDGEARHFVCIMQHDKLGRQAFFANANRRILRPYDPAEKAPAVRIEDSDRYSVREISPYTRFTESDTPILTLAATADVDDNLTITWTTAQASAPNGIQSHVLRVEKAQWMVDNEHRGPDAWKESESLEIR
jgi:hypothetical protein